MRKMRDLDVKGFLNLKSPEKPETFDIRETTMDFTREETEIGKYLEYRRDRTGCDADICKLNQEIYSRLWGDKSSSLCYCIAGDTMNSVQTTLNELCCLYFQKEANLKRLQQIEMSGIDFDFPIKEGRNKGKYIWSEKRCHMLDGHNEAGQAVLQGVLSNEAEHFLSVAYTIGNFIPSPVKSGRFSCNQRRGTSGLKDYWDLTLYCIYEWYESNREQDSCLATIFGGDQHCVDDYKKWLSLFDSWDNFVKSNYMQSFVYAKDGQSEAPEEGPFGPPKELWKGHFQAIPDFTAIVKDKVLPIQDVKNGVDQFSEFFTNAAERIKARSKRMVDKLNELKKETNS